MQSLEHLSANFVIRVGEKRAVNDPGFSVEIEYIDSARALIVGKDMMQLSPAELCSLAAGD